MEGVNMEVNDEVNVNDESTTVTNSTSNTSEEIDVSAFADIISEKDKQISQLQKDVDELKKANSKMLLQINTGHQEEFNFDESLLAFDPRRVRLNGQKG